MRLRHIHDRVNWLASEEARAALIGGAAADGRFLPEKERLINEADHILDELEKGLRPDALGPRGEKRPADVIGAAIQIAKIATGELQEDAATDDEGKDKAAVELGRHVGARPRGKTEQETAVEVAAAKRWGKR